MSKFIWVFLLGFSSAFAAKTSVLPHPVNVSNAAALNTAKSDLLLEINGSIYPKDQLPPSCADLLKGTRCSVDSYGHYHVEVKKEGEQVYAKATFADPNGVQVTEESWEKDGHVQKAVVENKALEKRSELEVKGERVFYKVTDLGDNSVKTSDAKLDDNLVVPSTVMSYIRPFHADLEAGKKVNLRIAVLDRRDSYAFHIEKIRNEKTVDGEEVMVLRMSADALLVSALVDPMFFYVKTKTGEMYAFEGKSALRRKVGDKFKEMAALTAYDYKVNQFKGKDVPKLNSGEPCSDEMLKTGEMKCSIAPAN